MTVREIIKSRIESTEPQGTILLYLKSINGKQFTERDVKKLKVLCPDADIELEKSFGMTSLNWGGYRRSQGNKGGNLTLAHQEKNVIIDAAHIETHNPAYFSGLAERNKKRQAILATDQPERIQKAVDAYNAALKAFDAELGDSSIDFPDFYAVKKLKTDYKER